MSVLMGDNEGEKRIIALEKQVEEMRLTIAEQHDRILALEEQLAEARKADRLFSPSIQKSPDDVKETHSALTSDDGTAALFATPARTTMGRHDRQATSVAKQLMKKQEGELDTPDTRMKRPGFTPGPLPKPSPDDPEPSK
jgi:hypothetical protein